MSTLPVRKPVKKPVAKKPSATEYQYTKESSKINFRCSTRVYDAAQSASDTLEMGLGPLARMAFTKWLRAEGFLRDQDKAARDGKRPTSR